MFPRLLALMFLLSIAHVLLAQKSGTTRRVRETCAVTNPLDHPFVPPLPYPANRSVNWFGTDRFWTLLPSDGIMAQGDKTFWFRQEWGHYDGRGQWIPERDAAKLTVTARRLDGPASPPVILRAISSSREDWKAFLVGGINFSTPGCWEVSGRYEKDEVIFVVWVVK